MGPAGLLFAHWDNDLSSMEPYCRCSALLSDDSFCSTCKRECDCTLIVCKYEESQVVVQKLTHGNPNFREFQMSRLEN